MVKTTLRTMVQLDFCHLTALLLLCYSRHSDSFKNIQTAVFSGKDGPQMVLRPSAKLLNIAEGGEIVSPGEKILPSGMVVLQQV